MAGAHGGISRSAFRLRLHGGIPVRGLIRTLECYDGLGISFAKEDRFKPCFAVRR